MFFPFETSLEYVPSLNASPPWRCFWFSLFTKLLNCVWASLVTLMVKKIHLQCGRPGFDPWVRQIPWRREQLPTPVFLPGESHGQGIWQAASPQGYTISLLNNETPSSLAIWWFLWSVRLSMLKNKHIK